MSLRGRTPLPSAPPSTTNPLLLAVTLAAYGKHTDTCERAARVALKVDPSTEPVCTCGLDEALRALHEIPSTPTLADLIRYVDSDRGRSDCYQRTDSCWREGEPIDRYEWFERLVRGLAQGKLDRDFVSFLDYERFLAMGSPTSPCASCGAPKSEHMRDAPHDHFDNGCRAFRLGKDR